MMRLLLCAAVLLKKGCLPLLHSAPGFALRPVVCAAVPLYDSLGESSVEFIINHAEAGIVFTSTEKLPLLEKAVAAIKKNVKHIVVFGEPTDASTKAWKAAESAVSCKGVPCQALIVCGLGVSGCASEQATKTQTAYCSLEGKVPGNAEGASLCCTPAQSPGHQGMEGSRQGSQLLGYIWGAGVYKRTLLALRPAWMTPFC